MKFGSKLTLTTRTYPSKQFVRKWFDFIIAILKKLAENKAMIDVLAPKILLKF